MAITYNAGTNTITVTAYTEATPCNFTDIFNADVAGGWGVVTRQCTDQFCFTTALAIGDGSTVTWFADTNKHIVFTSAAPKEIFWAKANGHFRLGELISGKRTRNGCSIITQRTAASHIRGDTHISGTAKLELYSSIFSSPVVGSYLNFVYATDFKIYNCLLVKNVYFNLNSACDFYNIALQSADAGFRGSPGTFDKIFISDCTPYGAVYVGAEGFTMKNLIARNNAYIFYAFGDYDFDDSYGINWDVDNWVFHWDASATKKFYRQYEFDLKVQDKNENAINGAAVKIWDLNDNLIVDTTTNANGLIATQTLNYGYYDQPHGDTAQMQTPHIIQISKAGYETYEKKWAIDKKTDWTIALHTPKRRFDSLEG